MLFSQRLKELRESKNLSQEELAEAVNIPRGSIAHYETSDSRLPRPERLKVIADYFKCTIEYLIGTQEENKYDRQMQSNAGAKAMEYFLNNIALIDYYEIMKRFEDFNEERYDELSKLVNDFSQPINDFLTLDEKQSLRGNYYTFLSIEEIFLMDFEKGLLEFFDAQIDKNTLEFTITLKESYKPPIVPKIIENYKRKPFIVTWYGVVNNMEKNNLTKEEIETLAIDMEDYYNFKRARLLDKRNQQ